MLFIVCIEFIFTSNFYLNYYPSKNLVKILFQRVFKQTLRILAILHIIWKKRLERICNNLALLLNFTYKRSINVDLFIFHLLLHCT